MKKNIAYTNVIIFSPCLFFIIFSCNNNTGTKKESANSVKTLTARKVLPKPPSTYPDTLIINFPAAVFYQPDSLQLSRIKTLSDSMVFDGSMHEYFYQMRNARMVIKKSWPHLTITEAKNYRYLLFIKKNNTREGIDLNTKNYTHGLFVFDGIKSPLLVDMTNIETEISFYLKE